VGDFPDISLVWITLIIFIDLIFSGIIVNNTNYFGLIQSHQTVLVLLPIQTQPTPLGWTVRVSWWSYT
jgi:hypothetical protein